MPDDDRSADLRGSQGYWTIAGCWKFVDYGRAVMVLELNGCQCCSALHAVWIQLCRYFHNLECWCLLGLLFAFCVCRVSCVCGVCNVCSVCSVCSVWGVALFLMFVVFAVFRVFAVFAWRLRCLHCAECVEPRPLVIHYIMQHDQSDSVLSDCWCQLCWSTCALVSLPDQWLWSLVWEQDSVCACIQD